MYIYLLMELPYSLGNSKLTLPELVLLVYHFEIQLQTGNLSSQSN